MTERLRPYAPAHMADRDGDWQLERVNERFRFCRYQAGQQFKLHQDGVHHRDAGRCSRLTFMIYLTDGDAFAGGDTVFYSAGPGGDETGKVAREIGRVRPRAGSLILFDHSIWHAGEQVSGGIKHLVRSDIIYRRVGASEDVAGSKHGSRHDDYIWALAGLGHGQYASGGRDALIRIWNESGMAVQALRGHEQSVLGLVALPGQRLASVSRDRSLRIWNLATGYCEKAIAAHDAAVLDITRLPDGQLLSCGADGLVKLWSEQGVHLASLAGHQGWVWQAVSLSQNQWASASEDGSIKVWDGATLRDVATLEGSTPLRALLAVGDTIWSGDNAGGITCWHFGVAGWTAMRRFQGHGAAVRRLRRLDAQHVASCGEDNLLRVWLCASGKLVFEARHENFVTDALPLADRIISASYDGQLRRHFSPVRQAVSCREPT
ncbi:2OG-Fe(II) oxygenase [Chitinimonas sp.]|uniref:2OG-Fe(II) oxygenase n=1 Tax=Chitinimonas sp. TaxID=1934313 RepID=UPI0035AEF206